VARTLLVKQSPLPINADTLLENDNLPALIASSIILSLRAIFGWSVLPNIGHRMLIPRMIKK